MGETTEAGAVEDTAEGAALLRLAPFGPDLADAWQLTARGRRVVSVPGALVSADVTGFTPLAERLARQGRVGVETITTAIDEVFARLISPALDAGGDVLHFAGDALMVFFQGEEAARRAVEAGCAMQRALRASAAIETASGRIRLRASIGVAHGDVLLTRLGSIQHCFVAFGPVATEACRIEKSAPPGAVYVSQAVAAVIPPRFTRHDRGDGMVEVSARGRLLSDAIAGGESLAPTGGRAATVPKPLRAALLDHVMEGEHRVVAAGFVGVRDMESALARLGVDEVADQLDRIARVLEEAQQSLGVTWMSCDPVVDGCSFYVCAGVPSLHDDDDDRLLQALRMVQCLELDLSISMAMNRGRAFAAPIGHPRRRTFSVTGDAVNVAARLMSHGEPDVLLVTGAVVDQLRAGWLTVPRPSFRAKGVARPIEVHEVRERGQLGVANAELEFVGRAEELALLRERAALSEVGRGSVIDVVGEAGMGKSRLVREAACVAGIPTLVAMGDPYAGATPFAGVRDILRQAFAVPLDANQRDAGHALESAVHSFAPDMAPWLPLLAMAVGAAVDRTAAVDALDERHLATRRDEAILEMMLVTLPRGRLVIVEDTHWLDDASRRLVARVAREAASAGWMVVLTRRPDSLPLIDQVDEAVVLDLAPLDRDAAVSLVLGSTASTAVDDRHVDQLVARGQGNPLFLRELALAVASGSEISDRIERILGAEIDNLPSRDRRLLRDAAVLGTQVDAALLAEVTDQPALVDTTSWLALDRFVDRSAGLHFRHDLFQVVAYEGLSFRRRRSLHSKIGAVMAQQSGHDANSTEPALVALHFHRAGMQRETWDWSVRAARDARSRGAGTEALVHYRQAVNAAQAGLELEVNSLAEVGEEMGDVAELTGDPAAGHLGYRTARRALGTGPSSQHRARLLRKHGYISEKAGDYPTSLRWYRRALREIESDPAGNAVDLERMRIMLGYGTTRINQGRYASALASIEPQLDIAKALGDRAGVAQVYSLLERIASETGDRRRSEYESAAMAALSELGDQRAIGLLQLNVGLSAATEGRWRDALAHYDAASSSLRLVGHAVGEALVANNKAELLIDQGRLDEARPLLERALRAFRASSYALGVAIVTSGASRLELRAGRSSKAAEMLESALQQFAKLGARPYILDTIARQAEVAIAERRPVDAQRYLDELDEHGSEVPAFLQLFAERLRACGAAQRGDVDGALDLVRSAVSRAIGSLRFEAAASTVVGRAVAAVSGRPDPCPDIDVAAIASELGIIAFPDLPIG